MMVMIVFIRKFIIRMVVTQIDLAYDPSLFKGVHRTINRHIVDFIFFNWFLRMASLIADLTYSF